MKRIFAKLILLTDCNPTFLDKTRYALDCLLHFAPIAFVLNLINWWFSENEQFGTFMCIALIANMAMGVWIHIRNKTFTFRDFFIKNLEMIAVVIIGYIMLEMLRYTAGNNVAGELFRILIQVMTLLYPISKVLKNLFLISGGKYPPEFIMTRLYNFEKNGDLSAFFKTKKDEN